MVRTIHTSVPSVALFQQFTSELINLKQQALAPEPSESTTLDLQPESEGGPAVLVSRANAIWNRVLVLLDQQTIAATRVAGPGGLEFHREAIYVMAVLADEVFVHSEWEGRDYWLNHLLEARLFQTHAAGEIFFRRLETLLRREDEAAAELATVYLMALSLGFRGKYWGAAHEPILDSYRARLFSFIARHDPEIARPVEHLFPAAYRNTIQMGAPTRMPSPRLWLWACSGVLTIWLVVAQLLWWNLTRDLNEKLCRFNSSCAAMAPAATGTGK
jgi:type VI secretion system protein ImpK